MLDVVFGSGEIGELERKLCESIRRRGLTGVLYFFYPTFGNAGEIKKADAVLVSMEFGVVVFDLSVSDKNEKRTFDWMKEIEGRQDDMYRNVHAVLCANRDLMEEHKIVIDIEVVTIVKDIPEKKFSDNINVSTIRGLWGTLRKFQGINAEHFKAVTSTIQGITKAGVRPNGKRNRDIDSGESIFGIFNKAIPILDRSQVHAALSCPQGPQRIRGVAGSGKTTVLALKAAHLHVANPDWNIAVTHRNMALESHTRYLIRRFMSRMNCGEPNWSKLHVFRAWGGEDESFFDSVISAYGLKVTSRVAARIRNRKDFFDGIFTDGLQQLQEHQSLDPLYDAILVDDAQEMPKSFFQFAYAVARAPKRFVWTSDEFQSLIGYTSHPPRELFGKDQSGTPRVKLKNENDKAPQDIVLENCYRSTPRALTVAHAMVCGIHRRRNDDRDKAIFQIYDDPGFWKDIGYSVVDGNLAHGKSVSLQRDLSRNTVRGVGPLGKRAATGEAIQFKSFTNSDDQWKWIVERIHYNINKTGLLPENIAIIFPNLLTARAESSRAYEDLKFRGIDSNTVHAPIEPEKIYQKNHVTIAHVFSAKETEFPVVYFVNSQVCADGAGLSKKRNGLFTGITRSTMWTRVCGVGEGSKFLENEFNRVVEDRYQLKFTYPTIGQIRRMKNSDQKFDSINRMHIDRTIREFSSVIDLVRDKKVPAEAIPQKLIDAILDIGARK